MSLNCAMVATVLAAMASVEAAPATQATSKPARTWHGVAGILRLVPAEIVPAKREHWTDLKAEAANKAMSVVDGDTLVATFKVSHVGLTRNRMPGQDEAFYDARGKYFIRGQQEEGPWLVVVHAFCDEDATESLMTIEPGQTVRTTGVLVAPWLGRDSRGWFVQISTRHSKVLAAPKR